MPRLPWRSGLAIVILIMAVAGPASDAGAGTAPKVLFTGPDFRIGGVEAYSVDYSPAVAWNEANGEFLVVWRDGRREEYGLNDIYGRLVSAEGVPLGPDFLVSDLDWQPGGYKSAPAVAWDASSGNYLVVWGGPRDYPDRDLDIYGYLVSAAGVPLGSDFRVSGPDPDSRDGSPVVAAGEGEFLIVWEAQRDPQDRREDIVGRRVTAAGTPLGFVFRISGRQATSSERDAAVAWNGSEYLVLWADGRRAAAGGFGAVYARRVSAGGEVIGRDFPITGRQATSYQRQPAVAWNGSEYLAVWQDGRNVADRGPDLYGKRLSAEGAPLVGDRRLSGPRAIYKEAEPAVSWAGTGFLVVWEDRRDYPTRHYDIYGRRVAPDGSPSGADFRVCGPGATGPDHQVVSAAGGPGFLVVWTDSGDQAAGDSDIRGRVVTSG